MTNPYPPPSDRAPGGPNPPGHPYVGYIPPSQPAPSLQGQPYGYGGYPYPAYTPPPRTGLPRWAAALIGAGVAGVLCGILGFVIGSFTGGGWFQSTPDDPYPFESTPFVGDSWEITLATPPHEATEEIMSAIPGHAAPADGMEYWVVPVKAKYVGGGRAKATVTEQVTLFFRDTDGRRYLVSCGAIPDDLAATGHPKDGESVAGNVCIQVPRGADGVWGLLLDDGWGDYVSADAPSY